ncbi:uncharacterized protein [Temnothorax nylanderi]|uniref:uncharacterized protein n=1 Tax=Temnothorax nylanderi TaxID=102681 RepID=UPI003A8AFE63
MDSPIKQYSIIETQDNGQTITSVVPTKWICDDIVLCPQNPKKESKAVKAYVDADSDTWKVLPCAVRKTYDSYKKAREMLPMAEDTDGFDTEKETGRGMRKKKEKYTF